MKCPNCGSTWIYLDPVRNEFVCRTCGFVLRSPAIDPDLLSGSGELPRETAANVLSANRGLGDTLGSGRRDASGHPLSGPAASRFGHLRRVDRWAAAPYDQRSLAAGIDVMQRISSHLNLPGDFRERAAAILRKGMKAGLTRGRSMETIAAASVYLAARDLGAPRSLREVAAAGNTTVRRLGATSKVLARMAKLGGASPKAESFLPRFASRLGVSSRVGARALRILSEHEIALQRVSPPAAAASALYLASKIEGEKLKLYNVAKASMVSEVTIRKYDRMLQEQPKGSVGWE